MCKYECVQSFSPSEGPSSTGENRCGGIVWGGMGHMAQGLVYLAQNVHQIDHLLEDYRKLEDTAEKSEQCSEDLLAQRDRMCEENNKAEQEAIELRKEVRKLANENKALAKKGQELEEKLQEGKNEAIAEF